MPWRLASPRHQQPWCWHSSGGIYRLQHQRVNSLTSYPKTHTFIATITRHNVYPLWPLGTTSDFVQWSINTFPATAPESRSRQVVIMSNKVLKRLKIKFRELVKRQHFGLKRPVRFHLIIHRQYRKTHHKAYITLEDRVQWFVISKTLQYWH